MYTISVPEFFDGERFAAKYSLDLMSFHTSEGILYSPIPLTPTDLLDCVLTPEEIAEADLQPTILANAISGFKTLPEWSGWTSQEAKDNVHSRIFNGWDQAAVNNYIDTTATNAAGIAGVRAVLKQVGAAIIAIRTILEALAQAIVFLRDLVVRFRR